MKTKQRNFWGWGYEGEGLDAAQRENLKMLMGMRLGNAEIHEVQPPKLEEIQLRAPRVKPPTAVARLVTTEPFDRASHTYGKAYRDVARALNRDFSNAPDAVAYPANEEDLSRLIDWCAADGIAAIPYGGGSSVVGGVEARFEGKYNGALSIDMKNFDQLLEVDRVSRAARIQGGIYGPALEEALRPHGYTLRHYPQSFEFSTLGGWIATRAGGHFATLYTHIDDFVESVRTLTPKGVLESRRLPGSGAGPSPDRMVIGSEGTLGFITEAWMRLQDRPKYRAAATIRFADFYWAVEAARQLAQSGLHPSNCRLLDADEAMNNGAGDGTRHLLLVAFESHDHPLDPWMDRALEICRACGGEFREGAGKTKVSGEGEREGEAGAWRDMFLKGPYLRDTLATLGMVVETFETAITWDRFRDFHEGIRAAVENAGKRVCGQVLLTCRFTHVYPDGAAPYYTVIGPAKPGSQLAQWDEIKAAASEAIIKLGGTITHHHAVGRDHRPWYDRQRPDLFAAAFKAAKKELDPASVMNPGVLW
jgi:alkyldihydroxyacetonephosphate synthase